ncbi:hypothetical protein Bcep18194_B2752 [Burkholderia lata]|uniref:Uncharacterized protein n=2 Tax=Burkholderia lata (strain ATCC 17760 / DSM 23089 / LMG 22485 / NCIMB 9086 / R18194 / 383) TaxID=482957 RepID=Q391K3_BURL3|nr:hypothetical protein Bcep18194_B2752 [Burkholderia lata]
MCCPPQRSVGMWKVTHKGTMAPTLDDLLNDGRLTRLFSKSTRHCALQLWILQIKSGQSIENRVVYGRLLPYSHSSDRWSAGDDDSFRPVGQVQAQVARLNLYVKSVYCADLLRRLAAGWTVSAVSEELKLGLSDRLKERFGATSLAPDGLAYRPVSYQLNRGAHDERSLSSPHGGAGAFSASITLTDKGALFRVGQDYDVALTSLVVERISADTGLDFGAADLARFGDLELLVFPALDDMERQLMKVGWVDTPHALVARFDPMQVPHFSAFHFRLCIANGGQIVYSRIAVAKRDAEGVYEHKFELSEHLHATTDSTELEVYGFDGDQSREGTLCCRWRIGYFREVNLQTHVVGRGAEPVKFDWLEKTTRPAVLARVKAALTINRGDLGFANRVGSREADPWVPANLDLASLFERLHPRNSEGRFFLRWGQGDGEGRLQFVEWFRGLLNKYQQHQIVIFDPYFEAAGLALLLLGAAPKSDYIVFTSLSKPSKVSDGVVGESDKPAQSRINNLVASCEHNSQLLRRIKLRIYGLREGRLHDRYILIMGADGLPAAGFNLSNSFQKAAENYPLLVTPIPADTLLSVEKYMSGLVQEAETAQSEGGGESYSMRLLFNSASSPMVPQRYEPLRFLENVRAGDVLSVWVGELSLRGQSGDSLKVQMAELGLLKDGSLVLPEMVDLQDWMNEQASNFTEFTAIWEVLGEVIAHTRASDRRFREDKLDRGFVEFLVRFLNTSFNRVYDGVDEELSVMDARLFREPVETLLHSSYRPEHLFHATKYVALTWSEYFTIKFLWWYAPHMLLATFEAQVADLPVESGGSNVVQLSLLSQIVSDISLSIQFDINKVQRGLLVNSGNGFLRWMGLIAIERQLEGPGGLAVVLQLVARFSSADQVRALGWMIHRAKSNPKKAEIYDGLVTSLHEALPPMIPAEDLRHLVDSMRGHMRQLTWAEPWLFQDVVFPLLQDERANTDDACEIWINELVALLGPELNHRLFALAREGQTTNITAFLFAHSGPERQRASLRSMQLILKQQRRIVQQPLASTSDWTRWDDALVVSMWILAFTRWAQYYLRLRDVTDSELERLSEDARELAMVRPMDEWRSEGAGKPVQLAAFLDQAEELSL